ncbi:MAG TPA: NIPSNAP family protein, partial [Terriglobia bacterium]|nr:NIPSNAP family protein [Terriglobia bacterium]
MERRKLLTSSVAATALALGGSKLSGQSSAMAPVTSSEREYYLLRCYKTVWGAPARIVHDFLRGALVPAANRLGIKPVGVFNVTVGDFMPRIYVLLPSASLETLANLDERMYQDSEFQKAGEPYLNASAQQPPF